MTTFSRRLADQISAHRESFTPPPVEHPREGRVSGWQDGGYIVDIAGSRSVRQSATNGSIPVGGVACVRGRVDAQPAIAPQPKRPGVRVDAPKGNVKVFWGTLAEDGITYSFWIGGDQPAKKVFEAQQSALKNFFIYGLSLQNLGKGKNDWIAGVGPLPGYALAEDIGPGVLRPFWIIRPSGISEYTPGLFEGYNPEQFPLGYGYSKNAWAGIEGYKSTAGPGLGGLPYYPYKQVLRIGKSSKVDMTYNFTDQSVYGSTLTQGETVTVLNPLIRYSFAWANDGGTLIGEKLFIVPNIAVTEQREATINQYDLLNPVVVENNPYPAELRPTKTTKLKFKETPGADFDYSILNPALSYHP